MTMNNGNTTIKSVLESDENVAIENLKNIYFDRLESTKSVKEVCKLENVNLTEEQLRISRNIVRMYVNGDIRQVLKTIQGSGKSKAVPVAIYYIIKKLGSRNFVYFSNVHDNKLSETFNDLTKEGRIIDPFTGEDIVIEDYAKVKYLKGLDRFIEEKKHQKNIEHPLGIYKKENGDPTLLKKLYKDMGWPLKLVLRVINKKNTPDYHRILKEWRDKNEEVKDSAGSEEALVVVAPKELKQKKMFKEYSWKQFYDEVDYTDTRITSVKFEEGRINQWKEGFELEDGELKECVKEVGEFSERIWNELEGYSFNQRTHRNIENISPEKRVARWRDEGQLCVTQRINLFDQTEIFKEFRGFDPGVTKEKINKIKKMLKLGESCKEYEFDLITKKMNEFVKDGYHEEANSLLKVKERISNLEQLLRHGVFMAESHNYKSEKVKAGKVPFNSNNNALECRLWTINNGFDEVLKDMFIFERDVSILSASLVEDWMKLKMDRFRDNYSSDADIPNNLYQCTRFWREDMEVNLEIRPVRRVYNKSRTVPGNEILEGYDNFLKHRINDDSERGAISPKNMKTGKLSWNSNAEGSNDLAGVNELFSLFTYVPPTEEFIKLYADMVGNLPPLEYNKHAESKSYKEFNIPEDFVEKNDLGERNGFTEFELDVVHKCLVDSHINDGVLRGREHFKNKTVYLLGLETDYVLKEFDGEVKNRWRLDDLVAYLITRDENLEQFKQGSLEDFVKWIETNNYDFDGIRSRTLAGKIIERSDELALDGKIIKEKLTDKQRIFRRAPKDQWLDWEKEFMESLKDGRPKSNSKINELLPEKVGCHEFGDGEVKVEKIDKELGATSRPIRRYKFSN